MTCSWPNDCWRKTVQDSVEAAWGSSPLGWLIPRFGCGSGRRTLRALTCEAPQPGMLRDCPWTPAMPCLGGPRGASLQDGDRDAWCAYCIKDSAIPVGRRSACVARQHHIFGRGMSSSVAAAPPGRVSQIGIPRALRRSSMREPLVASRVQCHSAMNTAPVRIELAHLDGATEPVSDH